MKLFMRTLATFFDDARKRIEQIRACLETSDIHLYTTYIHALKSATANVGAAELSEMTKMLEKAGHQKDLVFIETNTNHFIEALESLLVRIDEALVSHHQRTGGNNLTEDTELFQSELIKLKIALDDMESGAINEAVEALQTMILSEDDTTAVRNISKNIILVEYETAIEQIDALLLRYKETI